MEDYFKGNLVLGDIYL